MNINSILFYCDLRNYGFIEKNNNDKEVINILSDMHSIIDNGMSELFAKIYKIQTDTSIYILDNYFGKNIEKKINEIKDNVDQYMKNAGLPSILHICIVCGDYFSGYIKTDNINQYNVFGEIMNTLEKCIHIIDNSKDKEVNEGIVITKKAFELLKFNNKKYIVNELNEELYIV